MATEQKEKDKIFNKCLKLVGDLLFARIRIDIQKEIKAGDIDKQIEGLVKEKQLLETQINNIKWNMRDDIKFDKIRTNPNISNIWYPSKLDV